jgi:phosphate transport system permease protein
MTTTAAPEPDAVDRPRSISAMRTRSDRLYRAGTRLAGSSTLLIMALIAVFLLVSAMPAFRAAGIRFFTITRWAPGAKPPRIGVAGALYGTFVISAIALLLAVPVALATALYINELAPRAARRVLTSAIDLLAAVPSLIYGIWGLKFLGPRLFGVANWLATYAHAIPLFAPTERRFQGSMFICGIVVALMVLPIVTSVVREVFSQTPRAEIEGALALGATRWDMIRTVVLPFGRGGIIGGSMLGLGRALGETIAVALLISQNLHITAKILEPGGGSVSSLIALEFPEANRFGVQALMAAGLTLFAVTLVVNMVATLIVSRSRSGKGVEL